jgi:hypothetical protein
VIPVWVRGCDRRFDELVEDFELVGGSGHRAGPGGIELVHQGIDRGSADLNDASA